MLIGVRDIADRSEGYMLMGVRGICGGFSALLALFARPRWLALPAAVAAACRPVRACLACSASGSWVAVRLPAGAAAPLWPCLFSLLLLVLSPVGCGVCPPPPPVYLSLLSWASRPYATC